MRNNVFKTVIVLLLICSFFCVFTACDDKNDDGGNDSPEYEKDGHFIYFGHYPQTIKADGVTVSDTADSGGYYLGSDGEMYAKVVATPYDSKKEFSNGDKIVADDTCYFKVEPIRWRILDEVDGKAFILCDSIIDSYYFDSHSNNYKNSSIRAWLNGTFCNKAFDETERSIILTTTVDNSPASTGHNINPRACEDTADKVFLLSYVEVKNSRYGFSSASQDDEARKMVTSDYSRANGAYTAYGDYYGNGIWWLRSPNCNSDLSISRARNVDEDGNVEYDHYDRVYFSEYGVVPAMWIQL